MPNTGSAIDRSCLAGLVALLVGVACFPAVALAQAQTQEPAAGTTTQAGSAARPPVAPFVEPGEVLAIPPALLERLQSEVMAPTVLREKRLDLLVQFLFSPGGLALEYDGTRTRTISEVFTDHKANCLTFSLLFVALARQAGIDAYVQESDFVLALQGNDALYGNGHVNVGVEIGHSRKTVDIDSSVVSSGEPHAISDERALSHFYNNRGAELMAAGRLPEARRNLAKSIALTPDFTAAWNNLGVLDAREGALALAEQDYRRALEIDSRHSPTLSNMVNLYRRLGDAKREAEFEKRLFKVQRKDPFHQIILAMGYEQTGDYPAAIDHYRRAIRLRAKLDFVYFGLARSYAHVGDIRRATNALVHARDVAGDNRGMYQAKLDHLRRMHASLTH